MSLPIPKIKARAYRAEVEAEGLTLGLHPVIARLVAARPLALQLPLLQAIAPRLSQLTAPLGLRDIDLASKRVAKAIMEGECIGIETDHDCDGQTSHALLYYNIVKRFHHPAHKVKSYIGHRLTEGYGLSLVVAKRIMNDTPKPTLVITADNGSADEPRIHLLKEHGIEVIVTDHHEIPREGIPKSAYACLNPTRTDCEYGDPYIAGCMVAWLLMTATRQRLIELQYLPATEPNLSDSLDFVAVGTIADCVSIARSPNNRAVVNYGMRLIEAEQRTCWRAFKATFPEPLCSEDLGFKLGPLLNSDGRLSSAFGSVDFLLAETDEKAMEGLKALQLQNESRKNIQKEIVKHAIEHAKAELENDPHTSALCIYLAEGHSGIQGIAASRLKDQFGMPVAIFAKKQTVEKTEIGAAAEVLLTGSVRGIEHFHVRQALQQVAERDASLLIAFGGHKGAGGLTLKLSDFDRFSLYFKEAAKTQLHTYFPLEPVIWTDGFLPKQDFTLYFLDLLKQLEPFGREFEAPIFEQLGFLREIKPVGDGTHARVKLEIEGSLQMAIWFSARPSKDLPFTFQEGDFVKIAFSVRENNFRGNRSVDLQIVHMSLLDF